MISDGNATYTYDALNRLTGRTQGTTVNPYFFDALSNDVVATTDAAGTKLATYGRGVDGEAIGISDGTGARFALADLHGDVVGTFTTTATALTDSVAYTPFGEEITRNGARHDLGYQGGLTDPVTGKVNMHARWYQPGTGTFASRDSATLAPSGSSVRANRYTYADAAPLPPLTPAATPARRSIAATVLSHPNSKMPAGYMCTHGICVPAGRHGEMVE